MTVRYIHPVALRADLSVCVVDFAVTVPIDTAQNFPAAWGPSQRTLFVHRDVDGAGRLGRDRNGIAHFGWSGEKHRLENPGDKPLRLIEVQSGGYLGEDDIVRFEDVYGRAPA